MPADLTQIANLFPTRADYFRQVDISLFGALDACTSDYALIDPTASMKPVGRPAGSTVFPFSFA
jgi:hypothetical protein